VTKISLSFSAGYNGCGAGIVATLIFLLGLSSAAALPAGIRPAAGMTQSGTPFSVPQWTSLRIRMDDTLTSEYSMEGDPFSATVMDAGDYQGARVYGTIQTIDTSGRFRGHTTMILVFNRLVMPDGRRAPISAEIVRLDHAPSAEFVDVEGLSNPAAAARTRSFTPVSARARERCWAESSAAGEARASARWSVAWQAWEVPGLADRR
jgi:hypothetical protein